MELKVWVEGIQRVVCNVTEFTTCQDIVFALAHATGKVGRFTLIERWRNNERLLAPHENPLKILMKWGEYSSDVQFILQRSDQLKTNQNKIIHHHQLQRSIDSVEISQKDSVDDKSGTTQETNKTNKSHQQSLERNKDTRKSIGSFSDIKYSSENIGIVKGIPQQKPDNSTKLGTNSALTITSTQQSPSTITSTLTTSTSQLLKNSTSSSPFHSPTNSNLSTDSLSNVISSASLLTSTSTLTASTTSTTTTATATASATIPKKSFEFNSADVRNSLDRKTTNLFRDNNRNLSNENLLEVYNSIRVSDFYKNGPPISSNGALVPPPYRDPPPPRTSPLQQQHLQQQQQHMLQQTQHPYHHHILHNQNQNIQQQSDNNNNKKFDFKDNLNMNAFINVKEMNDINENSYQNSQYRELIQLIKYQREKINLQQSDLTKYDAEIQYLENKEREQIQQMDAIAREMGKTDQIFRKTNEELQSLQYVEEENKLVRQQEKTLKSEITLLRSKLANCETELLQCKNKIRLIMDDIQIEQRAAYQNNRQFDNRQQLERHFLHEVERIQMEIDQVTHNSETSTKTMENLKNEVCLIENSITEKKKQLEQLVNELKEVNLQSLIVAPSEEIRHLLEGSNRPGSSRRIIGSPRQLETAVPTSKNPHGVWV